MTLSYEEGRLKIDSRIEYLIFYISFYTTLVYVESVAILDAALSSRETQRERYIGLGVVIDYILG